MVICRRVQKIAQRLARALNVSGINLLLLLLRILSLLHALLVHYKAHSFWLLCGVGILLVVPYEGLMLSLGLRRHAA